MVTSGCGPENGKKVLTMAEYISKETLQEKLNRKKAGPANKRYTEGWNDAILMVKSMIHSEKAADVAPVRHGRWVLDEKRYVVYCSECSEPVSYYPNIRDVREENHYCPNCGAKMMED